MNCYVILDLHIRHVVFILTLVYQVGRSKSRSQDENRAKVVGVTATEGFLVLHVIMLLGLSTFKVNDDD